MELLRRKLLLNKSCPRDKIMPQAETTYFSLNLLSPSAKFLKQFIYF